MAINKLLLIMFSDFKRKSDMETNGLECSMVFRRIVAVFVVVFFTSLKNTAMPFWMWAEKYCVPFFICAILWMLYRMRGIDIANIQTEWMACEFTNRYFSSTIFHLNLIVPRNNATKKSNAILQIHFALALPWNSIVFVAFFSRSDSVKYVV